MTPHLTPAGYSQTKAKLAGLEKRLLATAEGTWRNARRHLGRRRASGKRNEKRRDAHCDPAYLLTRAGGSSPPLLQEAKFHHLLNLKTFWAPVGYDLGDDTREIKLYEAILSRQPQTMPMDADPGPSG